MTINSILEDNPVIAAVKNYNELNQALESSVEIIFVLFGDIININEISMKINDSNKVGIIHLDFVEGLESKEISLAFIKNQTLFKGIISTKGNVVKQAKKYGLFSIQRVFIFDTISLNNAKNNLVDSCDAIEVLPGVIPKVIKELRKVSNKNIVAGGLIDTKDEVIMALKAGATCVSASKLDIWEM